MMPALTLPLTVGDIELEFSVTYSIEPPIPRTDDDPEDPGGVVIHGVRCVAARFAGGETFEDATLEAIQDRALEIFRANVSEREVREACAGQYAEFLAGAERAGL